MKTIPHHSITVNRSSVFDLRLCFWLVIATSLNSPYFLVNLQPRLNMALSLGPEEGLLRGKKPPHFGTTEKFRLAFMQPKYTVQLIGSLM